MSKLKEAEEAIEKACKAVIPALNKVPACAGKNKLMRPRYLRALRSGKIVGVKRPPKSRSEYLTTHRPLVWDGYFDEHDVWHPPFGA